MGTDCGTAPIESWGDIGIRHLSRQAAYEWRFINHSVSSDYRIGIADKPRIADERPHATPSLRCRTSVGTISDELIAIPDERFVIHRSLMLNAELQ